MTTATPTWSDRLTAATETYALAVRAAGSWERLGSKLVRAVQSTQRGELERRLRRLVDRGVIAEVPTKLQRWVGAVDMMRFFLVPSSVDDYQRRQRSLALSCLLRFLDDPGAMLDPIGLRSARESIVAHLLHVVHAYPLYDLQLLESFADGLSQLEHELDLLSADAHPRGDAIAAVIEDPGYHQRLRQHLDDYQAQRTAHVNEAERVATRFRDSGATFGSLSGAMQYCAALPRTLRGAAWHLVRVRTWDDVQRATPDRARLRPSSR
jgi:hypothetical protein